MDLRDKIEKEIEKHGVVIDDYLDSLLYGITDKVNNNKLEALKYDLFKRIRLCTDSKHKNFVYALEELEDILSDIRTKYEKAIDQYSDVNYPHQIATELHTLQQATSARHKLNKFPSLSKVTNGLDFGYYVFYADPNVGKTAIVQSICIDALKSNDDVAVMYFSMDDISEKIISRFIAGLTVYNSVSSYGFLGDAERNFININDIGKKQYDKDQESSRNKAFEDFISFTENKDRRLYIYDAKSVKTFADIKRLVRDKKQRHNKVIVCVDAPLRIQVKGFKTDLERNDYRADQLDAIANEFKIPMLTTHEILKDKNRTGVPNLGDIKGSGTFGYNAKFAMAMAPTDIQKFDMKQDNSVSCYIRKNKLTDMRGAFMTKFYAASSYHVEVNDEYNM